MIERLLFLAIAAVFVGLPATAPAQYRDRDRSSAPVTSRQAPSPEARIDINHASLEQLLQVPGLKRAWAERVIRFRPYRSKLDLLDRGIVTPQVYDRIKDFVIAHRDKQ